MENAITGRIHSVESFGALDGPGIRFVVFLKGCLLRCLYCHNPDAIECDEGRVVTVDELLTEMERYHSFIKRGGVTLSGGEPLLQHDFAAALLKELRRRGIHTAIDTSGAVPLDVSKDCIDLASMLLLDIKSIDPALCRRLTGQDNHNALATLNYCEQTGKPVWIRHVVVPGYTLDDEQLAALAAYLKRYTCIGRIELLPFHKMGEYKWKELGWDYTLGDTPAPTAAEMEHARQIFSDHGLAAQ